MAPGRLTRINAIAVLTSHMPITIVIVLTSKAAVAVSQIAKYTPKVGLWRAAPVTIVIGRPKIFETWRHPERVHGLVLAFHFPMEGNFKEVWVLLQEWQQTVLWQELLELRRDAIRDPAAVLRCQVFLIVLQAM